MKKLSIKQIDNIKQKINISNEKFIVIINTAGDKELPNSEHNFNIYCINGSNESFWQISSDVSKFKRDAFVSIKLENGDLIAKRFSGIKYKVDMTTGRAEKIGWEK